MNNILIEVKGGMIQQIYGKDPNINVYVIDYDNIEHGLDGLERVINPFPVLFTLSSSFRDFFTENTPLEQEIHEELQRLHL